MVGVGTGGGAINPTLVHKNLNQQDAGQDLSRLRADGSKRTTLDRMMNPLQTLGWRSSSFERQTATALLKAAQQTVLSQRGIDPESVTLALPSTNGLKTVGDVKRAIEATIDTAYRFAEQGEARIGHAFTSFDGVRDCFQSAMSPQDFAAASDRLNALRDNATAHGASFATFPQVVEELNAFPVDLAALRDAFAQKGLDAGFNGIEPAMVRPGTTDATVPLGNLLSQAVDNRIGYDAGLSTAPVGMVLATDPDTLTPGELAQVITIITNFDAMKDQLRADMSRTVIAGGEQYTSRSEFQAVQNIVEQLRSGLPMVNGQIQGLPAANAGAHAAGPDGFDDDDVDVPDDQPLQLTQADLKVLERLKHFDAAPDDTPFTNADAALEPALPALSAYDVLTRPLAVQPQVVQQPPPRVAPDGGGGDRWSVAATNGYDDRTDGVGAPGRLASMRWSTGATIGDQ